MSFHWGRRLLCLTYKISPSSATCQNAGTHTLLTAFHFGNSDLLSQQLYATQGGKEKGNIHKLTQNKKPPPISPSPLDFMSSLQHMLKRSAASARALGLRIPTRGGAPREASGLLGSAPCKNGESGNAGERRKACCSSGMAI